MIAEKMQNMVKNSSAIRAMFEEGNRLAKIYGSENVFDFSLGNPNVPAPQAVKDAIIEILNEEDPVALHGYTNSNAGYEDVREAVAASLNERFDTAFAGKNIQNIFYQFFYNGYMVYGILYCLDIIEENGLMPSYFINIGIIPFITATRIFGLFRGRQIRINETPAFESQDLETVLVEEEIKKKSWRDSIKIDE